MAGLLNNYSANMPGFYGQSGGVSNTNVEPVTSPTANPFAGGLFKSLRDYGEQSQQPQQPQQPPQQPAMPPPAPMQPSQPQPWANAPPQPEQPQNLPNLMGTAGGEDINSILMKLLASGGNG